MFCRFTRETKAESSDLKSLVFDVVHPASGSLPNGFRTLYKPVIMLRVEEHSPGSNDETGHVFACRKVKSRFLEQFFRFVSPVQPDRATDL